MRLVLLVGASAGCNLAFGLDELGPKDLEHRVAIHAAHRSIQNAATLEPELHEEPCTVDDLVSPVARFPDGSTADIEITEDGFTFLRPDSDSPYELDLRFDDVPTTIAHDARVLEIGDFLLGRRDRMRLDLPTTITAAHAEPAVGNVATEALTTGVWMAASFGMDRTADMLVENTPLMGTTGALSRAANDHLYLAVFEGQTNYARIVRWLDAATDLPNGGAITINEDFVDASQSACATVTNDPDVSIMRLGAVLGPAWDTPANGWSARALPAPAFDPFVGHALTHGNLAVQAQPVEMTNIFPGTTLAMTAAVVLSRLVAAPGGAGLAIKAGMRTMIELTSTTDCAANAIDLSDKPIALAVGVTVGTTPLVDDGTAVAITLAPLEIAFSIDGAPADLYDIELDELVVDTNSDTIAVARWSYRTRGTTARIPAGVVQVGSTYIVKIVSRSGLPDVDRDLVTHALPATDATVYSRTFTVI